MIKRRKDLSKCPICGRPTHKESKYCIFHASAKEKTEVEFKVALKKYIDHIKKEDFDYNFERFVFAGKIDFKKDMNVDFFKNSNFGSAVFHGKIRFSNISFLGYTNFGKVSFEDLVDFCSVTFEDYVYFGAVLFREYAYFYGTTFNGRSYFGNATFIKDPYFRDTTFKKETFFDDSTFGKKLFFSNARFLKPRKSISTLSLNLKFKEETYLKELGDFLILFRSIYMKILYIYKFSYEGKKQKNSDRENGKLSALSDKGFEYFKKNYFKIDKQSMPRLKAIKVSSPGGIDIEGLSEILILITLFLTVIQSIQKCEKNMIDQKLKELELKTKEIELDFKKFLVKSCKKFISTTNKIFIHKNRKLIGRDLEENIKKLKKYVKKSDLK